ncbi:hypothetical protein PInf_025024 [Phytophthora infestans]|nr:hypothetical protein PInf_025024 [Phytophthora infestans]
MATGKIKVTKQAKSGGNYSRQFWWMLAGCTASMESVDTVAAVCGRTAFHSLRVPPHLTIKAHRESYLKLAADLLVLEAITPELCYKCSLHTMKFHARAIQMKDMPVGE